jgi:hypothetical protein
MFEVRGKAKETRIFRVEELITEHTICTDKPRIKHHALLAQNWKARNLRIAII